MSNAALAWAFGVSLKRSCDKFLPLVALANYADETGICYPSQTKLTGDTALDRKTVIVGLRRLCDAGLVVDTGLRKGTTGQVIVYRLVGVSGPAAHYTYRTTDPKTGEFYIGKRSFFGDPQADTYRGSGKWILFAAGEGRVLVKEILERFDTAEAALAREQEILREFQHDPLCRNEGTPARNRERNTTTKNGTVPDMGPVPNFPPKSPVIPLNDPKNGHQTVPKTGHGTTKDPPVPPIEPSLDLPLLAAPPRSDTEKAFENWNKLAKAARLPEAEKLHPDRRRKIEARLRENGGLPAWIKALDAIWGSSFLRGENERGWRADLDFVCQAKSFRKLIEGGYSRDNGTRSVTPAAEAETHMPGRI